MYREQLSNFMKEGEKTLFVPKNGGLNAYVKTMLPEIGIDKVKDLEIVQARGEDIPKRVYEYVEREKQAYGLTGDDLFDEWKLRERNMLVSVLNTYDWYDENAEYKRPALCLLNSTGKIRDIPKKAKIAVNAKYELTSKNYLKSKLKNLEFEVNSYNGDTEKTVSDRTNDCCVDIVYGGSTKKENNLNVAGIARFSDIVLIGENPNYFGAVMSEDFRQVEQRRENPRQGSYTSKLLSDRKKRRDKLISEAAELFAAIEGKGNLVSELSDLLYAVNVVMSGERISPRYVANLMQKRLK